MLDPPLPVYAEWLSSQDTMRILFDQNLRAGTTAVGNWVGCIQEVARATRNQPLPGDISGNVVTVKMTVGALCFGVDRVSYAAAPADVLGRTGKPAAPIVDFPVVVVP